MEGEKKSGKGCLVAAFVWLVILGVLAVAAKLWIIPDFFDEILKNTGSESRYRHEVTLALDSFSGYCPLRSEAMSSALVARGIKLACEDDGADYDARMEALADGDVQMAVFTIDSFIAAGARYGAYPATIVMVIDETAGADAIVAYKEGVPSLQDLDDAAARVVLTRNSPSEFLARTVIAHFNLPNLPREWWEEADGAEDVFRRFRGADRTEKKAYVLWQPYVSRALELEGAHLLLDSSKLKGYIVDVLVAERNFLQDNPEVVEDVVKAYLGASYSYSRKEGGMTALVMEDAAALDSGTLTEPQAKALVDGIEWKNTLENYAYFGLLATQESRGVQHIEDIISKITDVLVKTGAVKRDPLDGKAHTIFYNATLKSLQAAGFHPAKKVNIIDDLGPKPGELEHVRAAAVLKALSDAEWKALAPVARMRVEPISFARGTARINVQSERELDTLASTLAAWPHYYLVVMGHARAEGDADANLKLARQRADAAAAHLAAEGVDRNRIKATAAPPSDRQGESQSVSFMLGQVPY